MPQNKPYQSCLRPYEDEIFELRRKRPPVPFSKIAELLHEKHQLKVNREAVFKFVKVRKSIHKIGKSTDVKSLVQLRRQPFIFDGKLTRMTPHEAGELRRRIRKEEELDGFTLEEIAKIIIRLEDETAGIKKTLGDEIVKLERAAAHMALENERLTASGEKGRKQILLLDKEIEGLKALIEKEGIRNKAEASRLEKEAALYKDGISWRQEEIDRLNMQLEEETARFEKESERRIKAVNEAAELRKRLAEEEATRQSSLSWKLKRIIQREKD